MNKRFEVTLDLSNSSKDDADKLAVILLRNGYDVYFSYDTFDDDNNRQELCLTATDKEVKEIKEK